MDVWLSRIWVLMPKIYYECAYVELGCLTKSLLWNYIDMYMFGINVIIFKKEIIYQVVLGCILNEDSMYEVILTHVEKDIRW